MGKAGAGPVRGPEKGPLGGLVALSLVDELLKRGARAVKVSDGECTIEATGFPGPASEPHAQPILETEEAAAERKRRAEAEYDRIMFGGE